MSHVVSAADAKAYRDYLDALPHAHLTQAWEWAEVKRNWKVERFYVRDSAGTVNGSAQLLHLQDAQTGDGFAYIPRGPVVATQSLPPAQQLLTEILAWCREHEIKKLRLDPEWLNTPQNREALQLLADQAANTTIRRLPQHPLGQPPVEVIGTIPNGDFDEWFMTLQSRRRSAIRKGIRRGVKSYSSTDRNLVEPLYRLLVETAQRQGITHRPKQYFYDLYDAFTDVFFSVGEYEGEIVSVSECVVYKDTVYWLYVGNDLDIYNLNASSVTVAETFHEAARRGIAHVNMGGAFSTDPTQCQLMYFKSKFCGLAGAHEFVGELDFEF